MNIWKYSLVLLSVGAVVLVGWVCPVFPASLDPKDTVALEVMHDATKDAVKSTGVEAIGVGSWTSQKKYKGPLTGGSSDHDMRVVMTGQTDAGELAANWKRFQTSLKDNIRSAGKARGLSDVEINKLINSTNVYPPDQLVAGVESAADAQRLFTRTGTKPSLGNEPVEGIWGQGSKMYKQYYEEKSGKLFYVDEKTKKVMTGATDLTHLTEGLELATTAGEVNKAGQWAEKVLEQLDKGDLPKVAKQAERLRTAVNKARGLERLGQRIDYLDDIVSGRITDPDKVRAAIAKAQQETKLLLTLSEATSSRDRQLLKAILSEDAGKLAKMKGVFWKYSSKVPMDKLLRGFQLAMYYARVNDVSAMAGEDFNTAVLRTFPELGYLAGFVPGLMMDISVAVLEGARAGAYGIVTAFQECTDLVEGIHSVKGREAVNQGMTVDQMVARYTDTKDDRAKMMAFIWYQAAQASYREENGAWVADPAIQNSLYQKCAGRIVQQWQERRLEKIDEFNKLFRDFDRMMTRGKAVIALDPDRPAIALVSQAPKGPKSATIVAGAKLSQDEGKVNDLYKRMASVLAGLEGSKGSPLFLSARYAMSLDNGQAVAEYGPFQRSYSFSQTGEHSLRLATEVTLTATYISDDVSQCSALGGYRKLYASAATEQFSIVEDEAHLKLRIDGPGRVLAGETFRLTAIPHETNVPLNAIKIAWANQASGKRFPGFSQSIAASEQNPGTYHLIAEAFVDYNGKPMKLGDARHTLIVEARPEEKKPDVRKPDEKKPVPTQVVDNKKNIPAPTPQPEAKKAPRKFEEINEKDRQNVLDCLCQCSSTANQSVVGVAWDPKPRDASPDCSKASNGPCINQGFGCWRHFPVGTGECATKCYGKANVVSVPEATLNVGK
jgi:hypothetical protein